MLEEKEITRIITAIAENINSGLFKSKQRVFDNWLNEIEEVVNQIGWVNFTDKLNSKLIKKLHFNTLKTMYSRCKKDQPVKHKISTADSKNQSSNPVNNDTSIKYKEVWKSQFNISGERCMRKLENLGLTPEDVAKWGIVGDSQIMIEIAKLETQKRK